MAMGRIKFFFVVVLLGFISYIVISITNVNAQSNPGGFSLQVTPSPLVATVDPGKQTTLEFKVRNQNTSPERLKTELRTFDIDKSSGEIKIANAQPEEVKEFVSFGEDSFDVDAGQWHTQKVVVDTPKDAGFSYSFVILISREKPDEQTQGGSTIQGSVALFTLLNVNRPDATKELKLTTFSSAKKMYEYPPANFELAIENSGNTIIQPKGNIFISRNGKDPIPISTLQINNGQGYIIPGSTRTLKTSWNDGFPSLDQNNKRIWDWSKLSQFRIGRYTAKAVMIYDDGKRDVPVESSVTFWVIPWKILTALLMMLLLVGIGLFTILRRSFGFVKKTKKPSEKTKPEKVDEKNT